MANDENIPEHFPILFRLTRRCVLFFLLLKIAVTLLYISGNYQHFLDSSQREILCVSTVISLCLAFFAICLLVESFFYLFFRKEHKILYIIHIVAMFIISLVAISAAAGIFLIQTIASGF